MNYIDIIIVILIILSSIKGLKRGLVKEFISLFSLIIGIYIALRFSYILEDYLLNHFSNFFLTSSISIISFFIMFLVVFFALKISGFLINKLANSLQLGLLNKLLGMFFATTKVLLIISFILFEIKHLEQTFGDIIPIKQKNESKLLPHVSKIVPLISPTLKNNIHWKDSIQNRIEEEVNGLNKFLLDSNSK